ncbi:MAG: signal peptidase II [Phycisphaerae bacterium]|nr:signal peptidase II [Phycisphaerae bacterium]
MPRAWRSRAAWFTLLFTRAIGLAADLYSKHWAFQSVAGRPVTVLREDVLAIAAVDPRAIGRGIIPPHEPVVVIPHVLNFTLVLNPGAVFGMGAGQRWFFITFTAVAMTVGLLVFARATRAGDRWTHIALGLLLAGGVGNVYDRLFYSCVRDFIHPLPGVRFPFGWSPFGSNGEVWPYVSNVADALLIVGIGMLFLRLMRADHAHDVQAGHAAPDAKPAPAPEGRPAP